MIFPVLILFMVEISAHNMKNAIMKERSAF